jgi:hypothetical protein
MLLHLTPGPCNEALGGDLLEEFCSGRSVAWYWGQVIAAIATACFREIADHSFLLLFAAMWSMLAPAWDLLIEKIERNPTVFGPIWNLAWPWSTCAALGLSLIIGSTFIWTGMSLYLVLQGAITRGFGIRRIGRALAMSLCAFIVVSAGMFALSVLLPASNHLIDRLGFASSITPTGPHYEEKPNIYY